MKTNFMKGPWKVGFDDGSGRGIEAEEGVCITATGTENKDGDTLVVVRGGQDDWGVPYGVIGETAKEKHFNAHLIAAAPEMYEMLEAIVKMDLGADSFELHRKTTAILAKARGI